MQKLTPLLAAAAVCVVSVSLVGRADASALAGAESARVAIDEISLVEKVVCRPGVVHARTWPYDGCPRGVYRGKDDPGAAAGGYLPHFYGWGPGYRVGVGPAGYVAPNFGWGWGPGYATGWDWGYGYGWVWF
jgi:hypothetical protein